METPIFPSKREQLAWLVANKQTILAAKKAAIKYADPVTFGAYLFGRNEQAEKANVPVDDPDITQLNVIAVINTTNLMDGHDDVHIPGLWKKSLQENKNIMHIQEHNLSFKGIIADGADLKARVQMMTWKELGYDYPGLTEALVFDSIVKQSRNADMFHEYKAGRVRNHSVGMRYVKLLMAVNDKSWPEEYEVWQKYIDQVANKQDAIDQWYFFPVLEAKIIEGSAVPVGSNWATPTLENNKAAALSTVANEPPQGTQRSLLEMIQSRKILI